MGCLLIQKLFALCLMQKRSQIVAATCVLLSFLYRILYRWNSGWCIIQFVSRFSPLFGRVVFLFIFEPVLLFLIQYFTKPADGRNKQLVHSDQSRDAGSWKDSTYLPCRFNLYIFMHRRPEQHNRKFGLQQGCIYNNTASRCF